MNVMSNRPRIARWVIVVGVSVAILAILVGGLFELVFQPTLQEFLYLLAHMLPGAGVLLVLAVFWKMRGREPDSSSDDPFVDSEVAHVESSTKLVGSNYERRLRAAASDWYRCEERYSVRDIRERLESNAVSAVQLSEGLDESAAVRAVADGSWTDDPVAAAFLAPGQRQPLRERIRGAVDPGRAYHRRVDRTLRAIEKREEGAK